MLWCTSTQCPLIPLGAAVVAGGAKQNAAAAFKQLPQLWVELKDGLALKLVAALRQQAGLEPLLGLLSLPSDLKHNILGSLQVCASHLCLVHGWTHLVF